MRYFNRRAIQAEAVGSLDLDIHQFPDPFVVAFEYNDLVCAGSPHQARAVCFAAAFAKHFHLASNQAFENPVI